MWSSGQTRGAAKLIGRVMHHPSQHAGDDAVDRLRADRAHAEEALRQLRENEEDGDEAGRAATEERATELAQRIAQLDTLIDLCEALEG